MSIEIVKDILEELYYKLEEKLYYIDRRLASPIFNLIDDWQFERDNTKSRSESELKREILDLLEKGADVNEPELPPSRYYNNGYTPILKATEAGASEVVQALIENGANVNDKLIKDICDPWVPGFYYCPCLNLAVLHDRLEIVKILVKNGANLESTESVSGTSRGNTPLHIACKYNLPEIAKFLIENGAELNSCPTGWGHVQYGFGITPLHITILWSNSLKTVQLLIQHGADLEKQTTGGQTALFIAIFTDQLEMATILIENGANVNFINFNADGQSPLHLAAKKNHPELTKMLIEFGAEVKEMDHQGNNALELSLDHKLLDNFKLIVFDSIFWENE